MAQHQDLKRKGGADPGHQMSRNHAPPPLSDDYHFWMNAQNIYF